MALERGGLCCCCFSAAAAERIDKVRHERWRADKTVPGEGDAEILEKNLLLREMTRRHHP